MPTKGSLGVFIDSKMVYTAFVAGTQRNTHAVPIAGVPEDLDFDAKVSDAVRAAVQQVAPGHKSVHLSMPAETSMVRCFDMPALPKKEESAAVRFEAQKYAPFELKDLCFDYETLPDLSKKRVSVLFYAAKKSSVERQVACVENAGVTVSAVEILPISLARSFNQEIVKNSNAIYMLIRLNENRDAEMIVAKNHTLLFSRHVTLGEMPGASSWNATSFLAELRLSFDYFDDVFKGQSISKVYVSAPEREHMQALTETINKAFQVTVEAVSSGGNSTDSAAGLAVAHGAALRDLQKTKKINLRLGLIASASASANPETALKDFGMKLLIAGLAVFGVIYLFFGQAVQKSQNQLRALGAGIQPTAFTTPEMSKAELETRKTVLYERLSFFSEIIERRRFFTLKLNGLAKNVPAEIKLITFSYDDDVNLKGSSNVNLRFEGYTSPDELGGVSPVDRIKQLTSALQTDKEFMRGFTQIKIISTRPWSLPAGAPAIKFEIECSSATKRA